MNSNFEPISRDKDLLRFSIRRIRKQLQSENLRFGKNFAAALEGLEILHAGKTVTVAAYLPLVTEPPLRQALLRLIDLGHRVIVPVVQPNRQLDWVEWTPWGRFNLNSMGIEEPAGRLLGKEAFVHADLRLIPALAYDCHGVRLGQGGGYYDRALELLDLEKERLLPTYRCTTVGVVFTREILDGLPADDRDARIFTVLTEEGIRKLGLCAHPTESRIVEASTTD